MKSRKRKKEIRNKETDIKDRIKGEKQGRSERRRKTAESQEKACYQLVNCATERLRETGSFANCEETRFAPLLRLLYPAATANPLMAQECMPQTELVRFALGK